MNATVTDARIAHRYRSKPGAHGTLYHWRVIYRDMDPACPAFDWHCWAYSADHALDKFSEGPESDGWHVVSLNRVRAV